MKETFAFQLYPPVRVDTIFLSFEDEVNPHLYTSGFDHRARLRYLMEAWRYGV